MNENRVSNKLCIRTMDIKLNILRKASMSNNMGEGLDYDELKRVGCNLDG